MLSRPTFGMYPPPWRSVLIHDQFVREAVVEDIALGQQPAENCLPFDGNGDNAVTINELVKAVQHALDGCPT